MASSFDLVIFDLGGVLVELQGLDVLLGEAHTPERARSFWHDWLHSPAVRDFEAGRLSPTQFGERAVAELALPYAPAQFLANFTRWPSRFFDGAVQLLQELAQRVPLAVLSNISELHWARFGAEPGFRETLRHCFLSYQTGLLKPDADCFQHVVATSGIPPARILFLDDNAINVEGARRAGLHAERVQGVAEARQALAAHGLCD